MREFSKEERTLALAKAQVARAAKKEAGKSLKLEYADEPKWREMASEIGFRMAINYLPSSETKYMKRLLKHIDRDIAWWQDHTGFVKFADFSKHNPTYTALAAQGLILEAYFEEK